MYIYIYIYPPPRFARRREWVILSTCPVSLPKPLPLPKPICPVPVVFGLLGGRTIPATPCRRRGTPPKKIPKPIKNRFFFESVFQCLFGSIFGPFCLPTCLPKSIEMCQKSMPRCIPSWTPCLDRFLVDFCSQLGSPEPNLALAG